MLQALSFLVHTHLFTVTADRLFRNVKTKIFAVVLNKSVFISGILFLPSETSGPKLRNCRGKSKNMTDIMRNLKLSFFTKWYVVAQSVQVLCYKPHGSGFDSRWSHWNFSVT
jgi:hypothetical protein